MDCRDDRAALGEETSNWPEDLGHRQRAEQHVWSSQTHLLLMLRFPLDVKPGTLTFIRVQKIPGAAPPQPATGHVSSAPGPLYVALAPSSLCLGKEWSCHPSSHVSHQALLSPPRAGS